MKKCNCGKEIDEKYEMCLDCLNKIKQANASQEIIRELGKLNNNLYAQRTIQEYELFMNHNKFLKWDKEDKRFKIVDK